MDEIFGLIAIIFRAFIEMFLWFFTRVILEIVFERVLYNIGYYTIKILTFSIFPKTEKGNRTIVWTYISMSGLLISIVMVYFLVKYINT